MDINMKNTKNENVLIQINQNEKMIRNLDSIMESFFEEENEIKLNIKLYEDKIHEVYNTIEVSNKLVDPNGIFFTPSVGNRTKYNHSLSKEAEQLTLELEELYKRKRIIDEKKNNINEVIHFLDSNKICLDTPINNDGKNTNLNNNNIAEDLHLKMLEIQEDERSRIARDLHDTVVQNLTSLIHKTEFCTKMADVDTIRTKLELQTMTKTIRSTIDELRSVIYDLKPMTVDDLGLVATLDRFKNNLQLKENINVRLIVNNDEYKFDDIVCLTIFRIVQEACNNVIKHANANNIIITVTYKEKEVQIEIDDDGIGFNQEEVKGKHREDLSGFGISIMKERVFLLGGELFFINKEENEEKGTKVIVNVPYTET